MKRQWYKRLWPWIIVSVAAHLIIIGTVNRPVGTIDTADAFYEVTLLYREPVPVSKKNTVQEVFDPPAEANTPVKEEEKTKKIETGEILEALVIVETEAVTHPSKPGGPPGGPPGDMKNDVATERPPADTRRQIIKEAGNEQGPPDVTPVIEGLKKRIEEARTYPYVARKRGLQGVVRLALRLDERGNLIELEVTESSGYGVLDNAATQLVEKVVPYPHGLGIPLSVDIPIRYSLVN
jgi:TonB family protein